MVYTAWGNRRMAYSYVGNDVEAGLFDKTTPSYEFAEKEVKNMSDVLSGTT